MASEDARHPHEMPRPDRGSEGLDRPGGKADLRSVLAKGTGGPVVGRGREPAGEAGDGVGETLERLVRSQQRLPLPGVARRREGRQSGDRQELVVGEGGSGHETTGIRTVDAIGAGRQRISIFRQMAPRTPVATASRVGSDGGSGPETFAFPGEFETQRALWMAWPTGEHCRGFPIEPLLVEIIRAVHRRVAVELLVQDEPEARRVRDRLRREGVDGGAVTLRVIPHADVWMRDMGPIFLRGDRGGLRIAGFGFSRWGYETKDHPLARLDGAVPPRIASLLGIGIEPTPLIGEGGAREFNGAGVMIACEAVETQRNPDWSLRAIETEFRRVFGVSRVIWLARGVAEDDQTFDGPLPGDIYTSLATGGHTDEFVRFADSRTVLLAEVSAEEARRDPIAAMNRERLEESFRRLRAARDLEGRPFRILRAPLPDLRTQRMRRGDPVFHRIRELSFPDGRSIGEEEVIRVAAAASYLNFQVTNGLVVTARYAGPGSSPTAREKEASAFATLREAFPGRELVALDAMAVNLGGGGIHCMLQQEPARSGNRAPDPAP